MTPRYPLVLALLAGLILSSAAASSGSVKEGVKEIITVRRALGLVFLGGGGALALKGYEYHDEADDF